MLNQHYSTGYVLLDKLIPNIMKKTITSIPTIDFRDKQIEYEPIDINDYIKKEMQWFLNLRMMFLIKVLFFVASILNIIVYKKYINKE